MKEEIHVNVKGRVQLVMFRDFTQRKARSNNIVGTVTNLPDGSVDVHAQGEKKDLDKFLEKLHRGPVLARVDNVTISKSQKLNEYSGFSIIF